MYCEVGNTHSKHTLGHCMSATRQVLVRMSLVYLTHSQLELSSLCHQLCCQLQCVQSRTTCDRLFYPRISVCSFTLPHFHLLHHHPPSPPSPPLKWTPGPVYWYQPDLVSSSLPVLLGFYAVLRGEGVRRGRSDVKMSYTIMRADTHTHTMYTLPTDIVQQEPSSLTCIYSEGDRKSWLLSHSKTEVVLLKRKTFLTWLTAVCVLSLQRQHSCLQNWPYMYKVTLGGMYTCRGLSSLKTRLPIQDFVPLLWSKIMDGK